nr:reverse transcriptase domain-containing protein [Tanacetum cinerariifolium]
SHVLWVEIKENQLIGPELVQETTDKVVQTKEMLKAVRYHQKSYADNRRKALKFSIDIRTVCKDFRVGRKRPPTSMWIKELLNDQELAKIKSGGLGKGELAGPYVEVQDD